MISLVSVLIHSPVKIVDGVQGWRSQEVGGTVGREMSQLCCHLKRGWLGLAEANEPWSADRVRRSPQGTERLGSHVPFTPWGPH